MNDPLDPCFPQTGKCLNGLLLNFAKLPVKIWKKPCSNANVKLTPNFYCMAFKKPTILKHFFPEGMSDLESPKNFTQRVQISWVMEF